jgi:hypothetical protein
MRIRTLPGTLALAAMAAACATSGTRMGSAGGDVMLPPSETPTLPPPSITPSKPTGVSLTPLPLPPAAAERAVLSARISMIESRSAMIDRLPNLGFSTFVLDEYKDVADLGWSQMERWNDASGVRKIRLLPTLDRNDTEEFYYENGRLIMVYWNPLGTFGQDAFGEPGESFYFGEEGLIAWTRDDGTSFDSSHPDFKYWDKHLRKESRRFSGCC